MSTSRAAFLRAICECPEDDTSRRVYADWLDEHGDPERAEFIRLQVALAAGTLPEDRRDDAEARAAELLGRHRPAWWAELPHRPGVRWEPGPSLFHRGLPSAVTFRHGKAWREHAEEVFAAAPITQLWCGGNFTERTGRPVFGSPLLGRVSELYAPPLGLPGAEALADNPHLVGRLQVLSAGSRSGDGDAVAAALSRAPGLRHLETFSFSYAGPAGITALASSPYLTRLRSLSLHANPVGDDGAEALAASPYLSALEHVLLNYCQIGDRGAAALARSERLSSLRELYLGGGSPITDAGALAIASSAGLPRLAALHLWGADIREAGARALADFAERRGLAVLNLRSCPIPAGVAQELARRLGPRFNP